MNHIDTARRLRPIIEQAAQSLDDKTASTAPEIFGGMRYDGGLIRAGTRINWRGVLKMAAVDLWDYEENDPEHAPNLWQNITYREGIRVIPETITVTEAFAKYEQGWWGDSVYESLVDMNVYTPAQYMGNWRWVR